MHRTLGRRLKKPASHCAPIVLLLAMVASACLGVSHANAIEPTGTPPPTGPVQKKGLIIVVEWKAAGGTPSSSSPYSTLEAAGALNVASNWYRTVSRGLFPGWSVRALGPVSIPAPPLGSDPAERCDGPFEGAIANGADEQARANGIDPSAYDAIIYYHDPFSLPCPNDRNRGQVGGSRIWLNKLSSRVLVHELGHVLGLHHADARYCRDAGGFAVTLSSNCQVNEYADEFSAMGRLEGSFAAPHQSRLGWLPGKVLSVPLSGGTYFLPPIEQDAPTLALRLVDGVILWFEYRRALGVDIASGVLVHQEFPNDPRSYLLDMTLRSFNDFSDAQMVLGQTWANPLGTMKVTLEATGPFGAQLRFAPQVPIVPDVRGAPLASASGALSAAGFVVGTVTQVIDFSCEDIGAVIGQTPGPGTHAATGTRVNLTVGKKPGRCIID